MAGFAMERAVPDCSILIKENMRKKMLFAGVCGIASLPIFLSAQESSCFPVVNQDTQTVYYYPDEGDPKVVSVGPVPAGLSPYSGDLRVPGKINYQGNEYVVRSVLPETFRVSSFPVNAENSLASLSLPAGLERIGERAAYNNLLMTDLSLGDGLLQIGDAAFAKCRSLQELTLPESLGIIGDSAFFHNQNLRSLVLPLSLRRIGESAFERCQNLASVALPDSLEIVPFRAFANCGLESICIGAGTDSLAAQAFAQNTGLKEVVLLNPALQNVDASTFSGMDLGRLTLHVPHGSMGFYRDHAFWGRFGNIEVSDTVRDEPEAPGSYPTDFWVDGIFYQTLPDTLTVAVGYEFGSRYEGDIVIPDYVEYEGRRFKVTEIGMWAFEGDTTLTSVHLPSTLKVIGAAAFALTRLTEVEIPDSVLEVGSLAFSDCDSLLSVEIGRSVKTIGNFAFDNCKKIESIDLPDGLENLGSFAFAYCMSLDSIVLPSGIVDIKESTFYSCHDLKTIRFSDAVHTIGPRAFHECVSLTSFSMPSALDSLGEEAFEDCWMLDSVHLPDAVRHIGEGTFAGCLSMESLEWSSRLLSIGDYALAYCQSLAEVDLPSSLRSIGMSAFDHCQSLKQVDWPMVDILPDSVFKSCLALEKVSLPEEVDTIQPFAFGDCSALASVWVYRLEPPYVFEGGFEGVDKQNCVLVVPEGSKERYAAAPVWEDFYQIVDTLAAIPGSGDEDSLSNQFTMNDLGFQLLRNPVRDYLQVRFDEDWGAEGMMLEVYGSNGRRLRQEFVPVAGQYSFYVGSLPAGMYVLRIAGRAGIGVYKFVKY